MLAAPHLSLSTSLQFTWKGFNIQGLTPVSCNALISMQGLGLYVIRPVIAVDYGDNFS